MIDILLSILIVLFVVLLFIAAVVIFRAVVYGRLAEPAEPAELIEVEAPRVAEHLAAAIRIQTVSDSDRSKINYANLMAMHAELERLYPRLHATLKRERLANYSLLYTWPGRAGDLEPVLLCAHIDVVPADPATLAEWTHPPFSGAIADGFVWGRGALDMKNTLITIMESIEGLIKTGYQPERTLYLALGHDEEIGGWEGAHCIAKTLVERGEKLAAVFDEGGGVEMDTIPGVKVPTAMVAVAEKGFASLELVVEGRPGHSSKPPRHTAIGVLARALARMEAAPMPAHFELTRHFMRDLGPFLPFGRRVALANTWLFGGSLRKWFEPTPITNAMIRTTQAITIIQGGVKDNILPAQARAVVNCRLHSADTRESLLAHVRKAVSDEAVQINLPLDRSWEASPVAPLDSLVYSNLSRTIRQVFPEAVVAPFLMSGATDSRHYIPLTNNIFRFTPDVMNPELIKTVHGIDERMEVEGLVRMVQFYTLLIKNWTTVVGTAE